MHETIHQHGAAHAEVVAIHVAVAFQPRRAHVIDASAVQLEEIKGLAFVIVICEFCELVVDAVDGIGFAVVADGPAICLAVGIEHAEVGIETSVLLQHENDVVDGLR